VHVLEESVVRSIQCAIAILVMLPAAGPATGQQQGGVMTARSLAATCANCHGTNGVPVDDMAALAGRPKDDIVRKMQDFKAGRLAGTVMPQLAKGYTDAEIELIAGWFAAQRAK
jgi:cytochrome c553